MTTAPGARRLVVGCAEDDPAVVRLLDECLTGRGHTGLVVRSGAEALRRFTDDRRIDVLLLDVALPDMDGRDLCRALRAAGQRAPVMFLSAVGGVDDIVRGFAAGGLDHLVKPFAIPELLARVEALARRSEQAEPATGLRLDAARFALCEGEAALVLTPTEFRIVAELLANPDRLVRRAQLVGAAWVPGARVSRSTLDTYLHRLRKHLVDLGSQAEIRTVRGVGYVLRGVA